MKATQYLIETIDQYFGFMHFGAVKKDAAGNKTVKSSRITSTGQIWTDIDDAHGCVDIQKAMRAYMENEFKVPGYKVEISDTEWYAEPDQAINSKCPAWLLVLFNLVHETHVIEVRIQFYLDRAKNSLTPYQPSVRAWSTAPMPRGKNFKAGETIKEFIDKYSK